MTIRSPEVAALDTCIDVPNNRARLLRDFSECLIASLSDSLRFALMCWFC